MARRQALSGAFHRWLVGLAYWLAAAAIIALFGVASQAVEASFPAQENVTVTEWVMVANSTTNNAYVAPDGGVYKFIMETNAGVVELIVNTTGLWDAPLNGNPSATGPYRATVIQANISLSFTSPQAATVQNDAGVLDYNNEKRFAVANTDGYVALANFTITGEWYAYQMNQTTETRPNVYGQILGVVVDLLGLGLGGLLLFKGARYVGVSV